MPDGSAVYVPGVSVLVAGSVIGLGAWRRSFEGVLVAVVMTFGAGGLLVAHRAWQDAWQPSLRRAFDRTTAGSEGLEATLTGVLRTDAAVGEGLVSLTLD